MSLIDIATQSGWYPFFLESVVHTLASDGISHNILDIGCGNGKLASLLIAHNEKLVVTGIDIDNESVEKARQQVYHKNVRIFHQKTSHSLQFHDSEFDAVTFCSVLFLTDIGTRAKLLEEAFRVLKPGGKVVVLTPSGIKPCFTSVSEVWDFPYSRNNWTFPVWKAFTTHRARKWMNSSWLEKYALQKGFSYHNSLEFNANATLEIIIKSKPI